jgi:hypothetical protein
MTPRTRRLLFVGLLAVSGIALLGSPALAQCSMCQQVISQSPEARRMSAELNRAILLMFVAPYLVFTSFALLFFRAPLSRQLRRLVRIFFLPR